jgi:uncharacterized protein YqjF (DUF2071 family)
MCRWVQRWLDVLFLHWRVPACRLRPLVPAALELDTLAGAPWVSLVFFHLKVRPRWWPFLPGISSLVELNLRTYVLLDGRPGIYFLRVRADNRLAMWLARLLTPMPYQPACMHYEQIADTGYWCACHDRAESSRRLALHFRPAGAPRLATDTPANRWLLERYRLYAATPGGRLLVAEVEHSPWHVRGVETRMHRNAIARDLGLELSAEPDASHFAPGLTARFGRFRDALATSDAKISSTMLPRLSRRPGKAVVPQ